MAFRIDDDENRFQDIKDQIDQLEIQTFSPEVVARNESTRNTGVQTGDAAATNAYPQWMPIRDFGSVGNLTLDIVLNRTDSHVAKLTAVGDIDFAFSLPPGTNKMMEFILDVTIDGIGGYTLNLLNNIVPSGISIDNSPDTRTVIRFTTTDAGVTYYAEDISSAATGGGNVPDGTIQFQHLEWSGSAWIAQQALAFGGASADSGQIKFPNNTIGVAWRNATNDGNLELKATIAGNLDITRSDETAISLSIRSQHPTEADQFLSLTIGSGAAVNVDGIIDTSAAKLKFAVGGANRLTIDVLATTAMFLKSPSGITATSSFEVISTHVTEADQNIGIFVGSGDAADGVLTTSANIFKLAVGNLTRWELDVNIGNEITQTAFGINPLYTFFNDDSSPGDFDQLGRINFSGRNSNSDKIIYGGIFVESTDVTDDTEDATMFFSIITAGIILPKLILQSDGMVLATGSIRLDEISLPSNPLANTGLIYLRDVAGTTTPFFKDSAGTETSLIAGGVTSLDDLTDVTISTPSDGQNLVFDGTGGVFRNEDYQGLDSDSFKIFNQNVSGETFNEETWHDMTVTSKFDTDTFEIMLSAGDIYWVPMILTLPTTINGLAYYMESATANDRTTIGVYDNKGTGLLQPENLIFAFIQTVTTNARLNVFSFTAQDLQPGIYWLALKATTTIAGVNRYRATPHSQLRPILGYGDNDDGSGATFIGPGVGYVAVADAGNALPNIASNASNFSKLESGGGSVEITDVVPTAFVRFTKYNQ